MVAFRAVVDEGEQLKPVTTRIRQKDLDRVDALCGAGLKRALVLRRAIELGLDQLGANPMLIVFRGAQPPAQDGPGSAPK